jgi:non-specific serine/threonine protein kinase
LTRRESEVLLLLSENLFDREIADRLSLALSTVKGYTRNIYGKLGVDNRRGAVTKAREHGLLGPGKPLKTTRSVHNFPRQLTRLIGREKEIARVKKLLRENPLVTLTGSGGVGKTRLALAVAEAFQPQEQASDFPDGAGFVELDSLSDPKLVAGSVANVFGLREDPGFDTLTILLGYLKDRQVLLVIDNCEHLIEACAGMITILLRASPGLKVLTTSREPLGTTGEMVFRVPSLSVPSLSIPEVKDNIDTDDLHQYEAVRLFLDRAQRILPEFHLTPQNKHQVAQICQRLDGIPLAIELAASRVASLDVNQIATRLERTFRLLSGGGRAVSERQRTLRATIDWSYNLLSAEERLLLQRLSVFTGGWTLEAAENICAGEGIGEEDVADLLALMVNKSMVVTTLGVSQWLGDPLPGYTMRFRLLNTVYQYAQDRLQDSVEAEQWHDRHLAYYLKLAETIEKMMHTGERLDRMVQLYIEQENLRTALTWSLTDSLGAHVEEGLCLANAMLDYWFYIQSPEGYTWLQKGLGLILHEESHNAGLIARTYQSLGVIALRQVGLTEQIQFTEESVRRYRECRNRLGLASALRDLGSYYAADNLAKALPLWDESLALFRQLGSKWDMACIINQRCVSYIADETLVLTSAQESEALFLETGDRWSTLFPLLTQALIYARRGDLARTREFYDKILVLNHELEKIPLANERWGGIGLLAYYLQDYAQMETEYQYLLFINQKRNNPYISHDSLRMLAIAAKCQGQPLRAVNLLLHALKEIPPGDSYSIRLTLIVPSLIVMAGIATSFQPVRAARLFGGVEALIENLTQPMSHVYQMELDREVTALRSQLEADVFRSAWAEGRVLSLEQAIQEARALGEELARSISSRQV